MEKIKVIYLTGMGRSGGTLLGRILGNTSETIYVGELRSFWNKGIIRDYKCSCENWFSKCEFWSKVVNKYEYGLPSENIKKISTEFEQFEKLKNFYKLKKIKKDNTFKNHD